jgi:glycine/D-amino acid oxidase-like deaminating enzyme
MPARVAVACTAQGRDYRCEVTVYEGGSWTRHVVRLSGHDLERWARGRSAEDLVRDSFAFLLQREPKESILKEFDLSIIKRYFPDYEGG